MSGIEKLSNTYEGNLGIGKLLRDIRKSKKLTILQVANETGIAEETIRRIELDKFEPKLSTLETLSNYYRIDLIELVSRKRTTDSMYSDEFISKINKMINDSNYVQLRDFAEESLKLLSSKKNHNQVALSSFLYSLKYIKYDPKNGQNEIIAILENVLLSISPDFMVSTGSNHPLPLEVSVIMLLSIMYRQNQSFEKAIELLNTTVKRILCMPLINTRFSDYLASAYLNLAYTYHSMQQHHLVIETVDRCFENEKVNYNRIVISHLLFRKGLALYFTDNPHFYSVIDTSLSLMKESDRKQILHVMDMKYNLKFSDICNPLTTE